LFRPLAASQKPLAIRQMLNNMKLRSPNDTRVGGASFVSHF